MSSRDLARRAGRKDVAELRVRELVDAAVRAHRKVAPDVARRLELDPFYTARRRLEALVGVLGRDARGDDVLRYFRISHLVEINRRRPMDILQPVEPSNMRNAVQGDAHGHLELRRGHVDVRDALGAGVLDLEPRVQFEEVVPALIQTITTLTLDAVLTAPKSKKKPPTTSSDGHESPRWREGTAAPRDAE